MNECADVRALVCKGACALVLTCASCMYVLVCTWAPMIACVLARARVRELVCLQIQLRAQGWWRKVIYPRLRFLFININLVPSKGNTDPVSDISIFCFYNLV